MKYHLGVKVLAFLLASFLLLISIASALSIVFLSGYNLYAQNPAEWESEQLHSQSMGLAHEILSRYTAKKLGGLTPEQLGYTGKNFTDQDLSDWYGMGYGEWDYWITDLEGNLMENGVKLSEQDSLTWFSFTLNCDYPVHATPEESREIESTNTWNYRDYYVTETEEHFLYYYTSPSYHVYLRYQPEAVQIYTGISRAVVDFLYETRYQAIIVTIISLLLFIGCAVYLCYVSGRTPKDPSVKLRGLTRLPLDLYLGICGFGAATLTAGAVVLAENTVSIYTDQISFFTVGLSALMVYAASILVVAFLYAAAAQVKLKNGYWWRHSIIGWCLRKLWQGIRFCFRGVRKLYRMLPLVWQWLVTAAVMVLIPLICLMLALSTYGFFRFVFSMWTIIACLGDVAMVCYGAYAFGTLYKGAKAMAKGNLQETIPTKHLVGAFHSCACELNTLADAAMIAAKNQTKSERMKTELITNVSHDIKTPLTSIINYVDLLQAPHTEAEGIQYLEVLSRQSARMKKLVEDLMDMSKATTGNLQLSACPLDAAETVNQALGEFTDRLNAAQITPVFNPPETPVMLYADGRHTWRVLSNLLSNVVKYALPGTRLYIDMIPLSSFVQISLKNISAEPLNVSADELTERFVRGDTSRNTEGSGLGLNIAKSLMELQKGSLELLVDGDLFKVTLTFPTP